MGSLTPARIALLNGTLILFSICGGYVLLEIAYRFAAAGRHGDSLFLMQEPIYTFDAKIGYRYIPNNNLRLLLLNKDSKPVLSSIVHINEHGHVSAYEDSVSKPRGEFRIAVIGDSFTACINSSNTWPDLVQRALSSNSAWIHLIGERKIKVINFAMDGTGVTQWPTLYEAEIKRFAPDLLIVNFISDDLSRRFLWRRRTELPFNSTDAEAILSCYSLPADSSNPDCGYFNGIVLPGRNAKPDSITEIRRKLTRLQQQKLPWWSPYPFLLARTLGPWLDLQRHFIGANPSYIDDNSIARSAEALMALRTKAPDILIIHNPVYEECQSRHPPIILDQLARQVPGLTIISMYTAMRPVALNGQIQRWFNMPYDPHFSDYGVDAYARAVTPEIRAHIGRTIR